jgi:uncharacterized FlaG/YvyC family protein
VSVPLVCNNQSTVESSESSTTSSGPSSQSKSEKRDRDEVKVTAEQVREQCREIIDNYKKQIKKTMPLSDQLDMRDP